MNEPHVVTLSPSQLADIRRLIPSWLAIHSWIATSDVVSPADHPWLLLILPHIEHTLKLLHDLHAQCEDADRPSSRCNVS